MTPELITQWAREAGLLVGHGCSTKYIEAFAAKVAAHKRERWDGVEQYLIAAADGSMSRNNSETLAAELLEQIRARK